MKTILLFLLSVSPFGTAACILYMWRLISLTEVEVRDPWRKAVLRVAQVLVTVAAILPWSYFLGEHVGLKWAEEDEGTRILFRTSIPLSFCALAGSLVGAGTARKTAAASSVLVMVNWLGVAVFS
jgi:hypothetical protein